VRGAGVATPRAPRFTRKRIVREVLPQIRLELGPRSALVLRPEGLWTATLRMRKDTLAVAFWKHKVAAMVKIWSHLQEAPECRYSSAGRAGHS
jgi:hypothetical protein